MKIDYSGVYITSKGKEIDLTYLNTKSEYMEMMDAIISISHSPITARYSASPSGTVICKYTYTQLVDWFADRGAIYKTYTETKVLGYKCKKIKDIGKQYKKYTQLCKQLGGK